jgi:hypothetical protein
MQKKRGFDSDLVFFWFLQENHPRFDLAYAKIRASIICLFSRKKAPEIEPMLHSFGM